jgi:hypothetical protein
MIVNAAIFTCSICGEASINICSYCTKDACSNHRCERCKRCSDCCECEFPLSAEEPAAVEAPLAVELLEESLLEPEAEALPPQTGSFVADFLTAEESSVFAEPKVSTEPRIFGESSVFAEEDEPADFLESIDETDPSEPHDPTEPDA